MIKKIAFVAHPTRNHEAARAFFGDALGLELSVDFAHGEDHWIEFKTPDGKTIAVDPFSPKKLDDPRVYLALETDDIDAEVARLRERGVTIAMEPWANRDDAGKLVCKMAIILDPDGQSVMLHEIAPDRA